MKYFLFLLSLIISVNAPAQIDLEKIAAEIEAEGKLLYRCERASWLGTDMLMEADFHNWKMDVGGYFSYPDGTFTKCVYYRKTTLPEVYAVIAFDSVFNLDNVLIDSVRRPLTEKEMRYYNISKATVELIRTDTFFNIERGANLNIVAIPDGKVNKAYIVTGTNSGSLIPLGNDYLLQFDSNNKVLRREKLHTSYIPMACNDEKFDKGYHSHIKGKSPFITPTDICTLLLYGQACGLQEFFVVSDYFSIWNMETKKLSIITAEDAKKLFKDK